jgi:hypothetical protein
MKVRQIPPTRLVVRVGDIVTGHRTLTGDLTNSGHDARAYGYDLQGAGV